jgi:hypothetical protein
MGTKGLELVKVFPEGISSRDLNKIALKSMPLAAQEGDYLASNFQSKYFFSYIFSVPGKNRNNIASLVAVYDKSTFNQDQVRQVFAYVVTELKSSKLNDLKTLQTIVPNIYKGLLQKKMKIKISSVATLEFDFSEEKAKEEKEVLDDLVKDMW